MEQRLDCEIIKDLLPNYIEHMTNEVSNQYIEEHLEVCHNCKEVYEQMKQEIMSETVPQIEARDFKKYLNKTKLAYIMIGLMGLGIIAVITCFIVNLAIDKKLTWFFIVAGAIFYVYLAGYAFITAKHHRFIKTLFYISLYLIPFLGIIQFVLYYLMHIGEIWLWNIAIPISLIWLFIVWTPIVFYKLFRLNLFLCIGIFCFLISVGNLLTDIISNNGIGLKETFIKDGIVNIVLGGCFFIAGIYNICKKTINK